MNPTPINKILLIIFLLAWIQSPVLAYECYGPGGDGGPTPLIDLSSQIKTSFRVIETAGVAREFFLWEKRNLIFYRNFEGGIYDTPLSGGMPRPYGRSDKALSRIVDPEERFVSFEGYPTVHDVRSGYTYHFRLPNPKAPNRKLVHLFWHRRHLYSALIEWGKNQRQYISILKFSINSHSSSQICTTKEFKKEEYKLASGHVFPYATFYRIEPASTGRQLIRLYELNVAKDSLFCDFTNVSQQNWFVAGPVENVHRFSQYNGLAVKMTHPTKNLLWADDTGCRHFHIGDVKSMVPNHNFPTLFSWDPRAKEGRLHFLREASTAKVLGPSLSEARYRSINEDNLWMTNDRSRLFLAPKVAEDENLLMEISLKY